MVSSYCLVQVWHLQVVKIPSFVNSLFFYLEIDPDDDDDSFSGRNDCSHVVKRQGNVGHARKDETNDDERIDDECDCTRQKWTSIVCWNSDLFNLIFPLHWLFE